MKKLIFLIILLFAVPCFSGDYLGNTNSNPYDSNSVNNPYGRYGNPYGNTVANPYSQHGRDVQNPYGGYNAPIVYDSHGNYKGRYNSNTYDPESVSNPYGTYGNPYGNTINNPVNKYKTYDIYGK